MDSEKQQRPQVYISTRKKTYLRKHSNQNSDSRSSSIKKGRPYRPSISQSEKQKSIQHPYADDIFQAILQYLKKCGVKRFFKYQQELEPEQKKFKNNTIQQFLGVKKQQKEILYNVSLSSTKMSKQVNSRLIHLIVNIKTIFVPFQDQIQSLLIQVLSEKKQEKKWAKQLSQLIIKQKKYGNILLTTEQQHKSQKLTQKVERYLPQTLQKLHSIMQDFVKESEQKIRRDLSNQ